MSTYPDEVERALNEIMAALWPNAELGWSAWYALAANGEWQ